MTPEDTATLRARLLALRRDALQQLAAVEALDPGLLRLVADANACLSVLEAEADDCDTR